jgi:hypothetical protein
VLWRARRAARLALPAPPPSEAMRRAAGLGAAEAGLVRDTAPAEVIMAALLADLSLRGYVRVERTGDAGNEDWMLRPGPSWPEPKPDTPGPPIPLAGYERYLLRKVFRRQEELPVSWLSGYLLEEVYERVRGAAAMSRLKPGVQDTVRGFFLYLQALDPEELDPQTARDYLPYVIAFKLYHQWPRWGLCPPWQQSGTPGARQASHDGDEPEDQLAFVADALYAQIRSTVETYETHLHHGGGGHDGGHHGGGGHDIGGDHL